jgi:hypothetical protein
MANNRWKKALLAAAIFAGTIGTASVGAYAQSPRPVLMAQNFYWRYIPQAQRFYIEGGGIYPCNVWGTHPC